MRLSEPQVQRYSRQILVREVGGAGQEKLLDGAVAVRGDGPAAAAAVAYLVGAGVRTIRIEPSLAQSPVTAAMAAGGILLCEADRGRPFADAVREAASAMNPDARIEIGPEVAGDVGIDAPAGSAPRAVLEGARAATRALSALLGLSA